MCVFPLVMAEHVPAGDVGSEGLEEECALSDDLYSAPGPCVAEVPFEYCWTEVPPAVGHDMGGWYSGTSTATASWWGTSSGSSATTATMTAHTLSVCTAPCGNEMTKSARTGTTIYELKQANR